MHCLSKCITEIFVVQQQPMGTVGCDLIGQGNKVEGAIVAVANMEILKFRSMNAKSTM
jgi:hypothetical protein